MQSELERTLRTVAGCLTERSLSWALIGGLAVSIRTEPRFTKDADVVVSVVDNDEAEHLVTSLVQEGYRAVSLVEHEPTGRLATVRLVLLDAPDLYTDLLFSSSGVEPEIAAAAESIEVLPGLRLPVARCGHLMAMKLLARDDRHRPNDYDDLHALASVAEAREWQRALDAVTLIHERGFDRGRDLVAALRELADEHGAALP